MTDGNPLFATELVASAKTGLPVSIRDSVLARAAKLTPRARELLRLVSVIPGQSDRVMALRLSGAGEEDLAECMTQGLLEVDRESVLYRHELTRHAVESALSTHDRCRLNDAVLAEITPSGDSPRLVHHAVQAGNVDAIVHFGPMAARSAMEVGSYQEAAAHFRTLEPHLGHLGVEE